MPYSCPFLQMRWAAFGLMMREVGQNPAVAGYFSPSLFFWLPFRSSSRRVPLAGQQAGMAGRQAQDQRASGVQLSFACPPHGQDQGGPRHSAAAHAAPKRSAPVYAVHAGPRCCACCARCAGDNEVQRTMLEIMNQLDGFDARGNIKVGRGLT